MSCTILDCDIENCEIKGVTFLNFLKSWLAVETAQDCQGLIIDGFMVRRCALDMMQMKEGHYHQSPSIGADWSE